MEANIKIEDYLSEEELREIAEDEARRIVRENLQKTAKMENFLTNMSYAILRQDIDELIPNYKEAIIKGIQESINKDYQIYHVFQPKDVWEREESLGWTYVKETIKENKELIKQKVKECIENYNPEPMIDKEMQSALEELSCAFGTLSDYFWKKMRDNVEAK